jgi:hypothetical protein
MLKTLATALVICVVCTFGSAQAALVDNGGGLIYDTVLDITWYDNPNYDTHVYGDYALWAAGLNVGGVTGWRFPTTPGTVTGVTSEGEMGHLFYITLENPTGVDGVGTPIGIFVNKGPFKNISEGFYTSTTHNGYQYYCFSFDNGQQNIADINSWYGAINGLAVHAGNIGSSAVPLPPTVLLLGSGLLGLAGWRRFRKS